MVKKTDNDTLISHDNQRDVTLARWGVLISILAVFLALVALSQTRALSRTMEVRTQELERGAEQQLRRLELRARVEMLQRQLQTEFEVADIEGDLNAIRQNAQAAYDEGSVELDQIEAELDDIEDAIRSGSGDVVNLVQQLLERLENSLRSDDDQEDETTIPENER